MIAISQPNDLGQSLAILTNGKTVKVSNASFLRVFNLLTGKKLKSVHQEQTELALITILVRKEE